MHVRQPLRANVKAMRTRQNESLQYETEKVDPVQQERPKVQALSLDSIGSQLQLSDERP